MSFGNKVRKDVIIPYFLNLVFFLTILIILNATEVNGIIYRNVTFSSIGEVARVVRFNLSEFCTLGGKSYCQSDYKDVNLTNSSNLDFQIPYQFYNKTFGIDGTPYWLVAIINDTSDTLTFTFNQSNTNFNNISLFYLYDPFIRIEEDNLGNNWSDLNYSIGSPTRYFNKTGGVVTINETGLGTFGIRWNASILNLGDKVVVRAKTNNTGVAINYSVIDLGTAAWYFSYESTDSCSDGKYGYYAYKKREDPGCGNRNPSSGSEARNDTYAVFEIRSPIAGGWQYYLNNSLNVSISTGHNLPYTGIELKTSDCPNCVLTIDEVIVGSFTAYNWSIGTSDVVYSIINKILLVNGTFNVSAMNSSENLGIALNFSDPDFDTVSSNETFWFKNGEMIISAINSTFLHEKNFSYNDIINFTFRSSDGKNFSSFIQNITITINDTIIPILIGNESNRTSGTNGNQLTIAINASDAGGNISELIGEFTDPDTARTNITFTNTSLNNKGNETVRFVGSITLTKTGEWGVRFFVTDYAGNTNRTPDRYLTFVVNAASNTPSGGGGGGGGGGCDAGFTNVNGTCIPTSNVTANLTRAPRCGDTFCDAFAGEDIFSCPLDCPLNKVRASYLTCTDPTQPCFFKTQKVVAYAIGFIIGGGVLFLSVSKGGKGKDAVERAKNWLVTSSSRFRMRGFQ